MNLTTEQREQAAAELKRFGADLQLSDDQKQRLQEALAEGRAKLGEYLKNNPNTTKADIAKQVGKAKEFLGQAIAA